MNKPNECTQCDWCGTDEQKIDIMQPDGMGLLTCPKCGSGEFYVTPQVKNFSSNSMLADEEGDSNPYLLTGEELLRTEQARKEGRY